MAGHAKFRVYYLASPDDPRLPRWIDYQRHGEHRWRPMYENRVRLPESRLVRWFRESKEEPMEIPVLGRNVALNQEAATELVRFMVNETNRPCHGNPEQQAEFLCNESHPGGRGCGREVTQNRRRWISNDLAVRRGSREGVESCRSVSCERLQGHSHDPGNPIWA